jgi:imidazolonepropionase-like amidohydrolase
VAWERFYRVLMDLLDDSKDAGGRVTVSSDAGFIYHLFGFSTIEEMELLQEAGFTPGEVVEIMSLNGAKVLGIDDEVGTLEPGKLADLVILDGNPLEDLRHTNTVRRVMKNGRLYEGDTLNEIWPRERTLEREGWVRDEPVGVPGTDQGRSSPR